MNFKDHPVNHDHKPSPQSEQAGENDGFLQSLRSSIQHFKKEGKGEFAAGILLAVNRYKEYAALWQAASQEKGVGGMKVYSRPECPFQYCDSPNKECEKMNKCHHRP